jgi:hypothetical protein
MKIPLLQLRKLGKTTAKETGYSTEIRKDILKKVGRTVLYNPLTPPPILHDTQHGHRNSSVRGKKQELRTSLGHQNWAHSTIPDFRPAPAD